MYPQGYRPVTSGENDNFSFAVGFRGEGFGHDWDLSLVTGLNDYTFGVSNSINPSFGAASATSFNLAGFEFLRTTINADLVREFEAATLGYGAEVRLENYETTAGDPQSYEAGPDAATKAVGAEAGPGLAADSTVDIDRTVFALYGDLQVPVTDLVPGCYRRTLRRLRRLRQFD